MGMAREPQISIWRIANVFLRHRWLIVGLSFGLAAFTVIRGLLEDRTYSASTTFMTVSRTGSSAVSGPAAQFGLAVPGGDASQSPQFYMDLVRTRAILSNVVQSTYNIRDNGKSVEGNLVTLFGVPAAPSAARDAAAVERLAGQIRLSSTPKTGVVTLTVTQANGDLAVQVANRILEELNEFNRIRRQSQASSEKTFIEQRLSEVGRELRAAEDQLQQFLQRNREYRSSPQLSFEFDRIARLVAMRQEMYTALAQSYEQAKVEEIRDSPVLTVIEPPTAPLRPDPRGLRNGLLTAFFLGALAGVLLSLMLDYFRTQRERRTDDFADFIRLKGKFTREITFPLRVLGLGRRAAHRS